MPSAEYMPSARYILSVCQLVTLIDHSHDIKFCWHAIRCSPLAWHVSSALQGLAVQGSTWDTAEGSIPILLSGWLLQTQSGPSCYWCATYGCPLTIRLDGSLLICQSQCKVRNKLKLAARFTYTTGMRFLVTGFHPPQRRLDYVMDLSAPLRCKTWLTAPLTEMGELEYCFMC